MGDVKHEPTDADLVELYAAGSEVEAERVVMLLLDDGIEASRRELSMPLLPEAGQGRHLVVVFAADRARAHERLRGAIADGVLPAAGTFLSE